MRRLIALLVFAMLIAACSRASGVVEVTDSWAPSMPPNAPTGVIYLTIDNGSATDDRIVDVTTDRCGAVELHATQIDENRIMRMRLAGPESLEIPSGSTLEMSPGALHVMCIDPPTPFEEGETIDLTVSLEKAGTLEVTTPVENR